MRKSQVGVFKAQKIDFKSKREAPSSLFPMDSSCCSRRLQAFFLLLCQARETALSLELIYRIFIAIISHIVILKCIFSHSQHLSHYEQSSIKINKPASAVVAKAVFYSVVHIWCFTCHNFCKKTFCTYCHICDKRVLCTAAASLQKNGHTMQIPSAQVQGLRCCPTSWIASHEQRKGVAPVAASVSRCCWWLVTDRLWPAGGGSA